MVDVQKLDPWRLAHVEELVFREQGQTEGDVAGVVRLMINGFKREVAFSVQQYDEGLKGPFVALSSTGHTRCTDVDVSRFMKFAGFSIVREISDQGTSDFVRSFQIVDRRPH